MAERNVQAATLSAHFDAVEEALAEIDPTGHPPDVAVAKSTVVQGLDALRAMLAYSERTGTVPLADMVLVALHVGGSMRRVGLAAVEEAVAQRAKEIAAGRGTRQGGANARAAVQAKNEKNVTDAWNALATDRKYERWPRTRIVGEIAKRCRVSVKTAREIAKRLRLEWPTAGK